MKIIVFGTNACPDCVEAIEKLDEVKADYMYLEFSNNMPNLKRFLKLRDTEPILRKDTIEVKGVGLCKMLRPHLPRNVLENIHLYTLTLF